MTIHLLAEQFDILHIIGVHSIHCKSNLHEALNTKYFSQAIKLYTNKHRLEMCESSRDEEPIKEMKVSQELIVTH